MSKSLLHAEEKQAVPLPVSESRETNLPPGWVLGHRQNHMCPKCKKHALSRVPRPLLLKSLLPWLQVRKYKCTHCFKTCYKYKRAATRGE